MIVARRRYWASPFAIESRAVGTTWAATVAGGSWRLFGAFSDFTMRRGELIRRLGGIAQCGGESFAMLSNTVSAGTRFPRQLFVPPDHAVVVRGVLP